VDHAQKGARNAAPSQPPDVLVLELAASYVVSRAEELTTVLDAMDSLAEFERMQRPPTG
jgi:hypothetical protein